MTTNPGDTPSPKELMKAANQHQEDGNLEEAITLYRLLIRQEPTASGAYYNLGLALRKAGKVAEAIDCLKQTLALSPGNTAILTALGKTYLQNKQPAEARSTLNAALAIDPASPEPQYLLGIIARDCGDYDQAATCFRKLASNSSGIPAAALLELGKALYHKKEYTEALSCFAQLHGEPAQNFEACYFSGIIHYHAGETDAAISALRNAVSIAPHNPHGHYQLGNAYFRAGQLAEAIDCYQKAIHAGQQEFQAWNFNMGGCWLNLGLAYKKKGDQQAALQSYQKSIQFSTDEDGPWRLRIESSSACNLRCQHCPTGLLYKHTERTIMSPELFETLLGQIRAIRNLNDCVLYLGGEPLLNKNLPQMCRRIRLEKGAIRISFNTNAMLVNEEICRQLAEVDVDQIQISVDGRSPEENDRIRQGAHYETVARNIRLLQRSLPKTEIGIANTIVKRHDDPVSAETPAFILQDFPDLPVSTTYAMKWPGLDAGSLHEKHLQVDLLPARGYCDKPFTEMVVRANGDITLCCYDILGQHVLGNIMHDNLLGIWKGPIYQQLREAIAENRIEALPQICRNCVVYSGEYLLTETSGTESSP